MQLWQLFLRYANVTYTIILWLFFWDYPGEPVREEIFRTLWCKGR